MRGRGAEDGPSPRAGRGDPRRVHSIERKRLVLPSDARHYQQMSQGNPAPVFGVVSAVSAISGVAHAGAPVIVTSESQLNKAADTTDESSACIGLLLRPVALGDVGAVQFAGPLTLELDQWNEVIQDEAPDGLQPGKAYFLSGTAGEITVVAGGVTQKVGIASSQHTLIVGLTGPNDVQGS